MRDDDGEAASDQSSPPHCTPTLALQSVLRPRSWRSPDLNLSLRTSAVYRTAIQQRSKNTLRARRAHRREVGMQ